MDNLISFTHTEAVLRRYAEEATELYKRNLKESGREATGTLLDSIRTEVVLGGSVIAVDMTLSDYWKYVEYDTKPHWMPSGTLIPWIKAKRLPTGDGKTLPTPAQLDYLIRRKIAGESPTGLPGGTRGSHDLAYTIDELNIRYRDLIADAVAEDFADAAEVVIRTFVNN